MASLPNLRAPGDGSGRALGGRLVLMGRIGRPKGVAGWLWLQSYAQRPEDLVERYRRWFVADRAADGGWRELRVSQSLIAPKGPQAKLDGVDDRTAAEGLVNKEIYVERDELGEPGAGGVFLMDFVGMAAVGRHDERLGVVVDVVSNGAGDLLVVAPDDANPPEPPRSPEPPKAQGKAALGGKAVKAGRPKGPKRPASILIPLVMGAIVTAVDRETGVVRVEWGKDY